MYSKIFKNYQVNVGIPFNVKSPINFDTIKKLEIMESQQDEEYPFLVDEEQQSIIMNASEEAELIIKEAQLEAQRIIDNSEREAAEYSAKIEEEARQIGYDDGFNDAKMQYSDLINEAEMIKEKTKSEYQENLASIEVDTVNMILAIAKRVIGFEISVNREDILFLVKQAFEKCTNKENLVLKIAKEDFDYLQANRDRLNSMVDGISEVVIRKDSALKSGACIIETPYGIIDAGINTKIKKIEEAFRQILNK